MWLFDSIGLLWERFVDWRRKVSECLIKYKNFISSIMFKIWNEFNNFLMLCYLGFFYSNDDDVVLRVLGNLGRIFVF